MSCVTFNLNSSKASLLRCFLSCAPGFQSAVLPLPLLFSICHSAAVLAPALPPGTIRPRIPALPHLFSLSSLLRSRRGPPTPHPRVSAPLLSDDGILLLYNGDAGPQQAETLARAATPHYLPLHPKMFYSIGWALFDRNDPTRLIARCEEPLIVPDRLYEFYGIADFVCFASGLVEFKGKHILYYGCADMRISAAYAD